MAADSVFSKLPDDVVLNILDKVEHDPRIWSTLACVCTRFASLIRTVCFRSKCVKTIPAVVSDLVASPDGSPPGGWAALFKLSVCCPGLSHSGVLLENSDFGLEREIGPDAGFGPDEGFKVTGNGNFNSSSFGSVVDDKTASSSRVAEAEASVVVTGGGDGMWSLYDDLFYDTLYNDSESMPETQTQPEAGEKRKAKVSDMGCEKKQKVGRPLRPHLATGNWSLSREQGNKLLASRFKGDCLYICDWPGCLHDEERRNYMLFRGVFKNFKQSRVWRTLNEGDKSVIDMNCEFCASNRTWDMHSSFCLRRYFGYHDDGEPVVRAYVCENGHVAGAWTDWPLYT